MKLLDLLRAHWNIWGLDAPRFAWIAAAFLLGLPVCVLLFLWWNPACGTPYRRESWPGPWILFEADCIKKHVPDEYDAEFSIGCGPIPPDSRLSGG